MKNNFKFYGKCFLPIIAGIISILNYYLVPDFGSNTKTNIYPALIGIFIIITIIKFIVGFFKKPVLEKLSYKGPFNTAVIILLMILDIMTLKTGFLEMPFFPWPDNIINAIITDRKILFSSTCNSLLLLLTGYFFGVLVGFISGLFAGYSEKVNYWMAPILRILGPIPSIVWLSIIFILFGSRMFEGSVFLIALGTWYPVTFSTLTGIRNVKKTYFELADIMGANKVQKMFKIAIPAASPNIFQGLTQGMSVACTSLMIAEMLGVESGLGWYITWQKGWSNFSGVFGATFIICVIFLSITKLLNIIKSKVLIWQEGFIR
ncbi:ABC transporter permease [Miniphocaeibacter massiliensis]|uniref:ABC transporter permease n=1 Tax=Miniphocaeibacter massiliensis TaxID=2041841 RepID=UPI000C1BF955|nr:ABC transporter permease subunit [Miniphocaeibacter massiliensis]